MTLAELIRILRSYEREVGSDAYVVLADEATIIGDAVSVGLSDDGEVVISVMD